MGQDKRFEELIAAGLAASGENHRDEALDLFAQAGAEQPSSGIPHFLIASEHAAAGDLQAAEAAFANAVLLAPDFPLARYQLGLLQFSSARASLALLTWEPLFALPASESLGHFVRGFAALAQDRYVECLDHFTAGVEAPGVNPAVASDIRQVMEAVQRLLLRPNAGEDAAGTHVLLAGYARALH